MPQERCLDIDSELDCKIVRVLLQERLNACSTCRKTVFVTGAAGLLGSTYTRRMLAVGARVLATDLESHRSDALMSAHVENPGSKFEHLDVNDESQVEGTFRRLGNDDWEPNVVLNNAAITGELLMGAGKEFPELSETTLSDWNRTLQTNLTGAFLIAREMDRDVVGKYPSTLINVASMYALNGPHITGFTKGCRFGLSLPILPQRPEFTV